MTQIVNRHWLFLVLVFLIGLATAPTAETAPAMQTAVGDYEEVDCFFDTGSEFITPAALGFTCGYVTVPEQHSDPDGPTIRLPIAIRKATSSSASPDPLFLAQGGPGGDAFGIFSITAPNSAVAADRDIVVFNQRGTRYAEPDLQCDEYWDLTGEILPLTDEDEILRLTNDATDACRSRLLSEGINLSAYDSLENAADIDVIRQALGYESYNYYGVSYGTLLGLHLMNLQPPALRSVILDSVVPTQTNFAAAVPQTENRAYDEYFAFCDADATCREQYPNLEPRLTAIYEQLNETPAELRLYDDETGNTYDAVLTGDGLRSIVFQLFYVGDFYAVFPRMVADLEQGDYWLVENLYPLFAFDRSFANGMYYSVFCAEESEYSTDDVSTDGLRPFIADSAIEEAESLVDICTAWQVDPLAPAVNEPVQSSIPTLLLSGRFDPITPPSYAEEAAKTLSTSYNVLNPIGAHGNVFNGNDCTEGIMSDFLNAPTVSPDTSCLADSEFVPVVAPDVVQVPNLQKLGNLDVTVSVQFGLLALFGILLLSGLLLWPLAWLVRKIRNRDKVVADPRSRIFGRIAVLLTGFLTLALVGGMTFYIIELFSQPAMFLYGAFPAAARPLFVLGPVLILLTIVGIIYLVRSWQDASLLGKIYQGFLIVCLLGVSVLMIMLELITPLFA